MNNVMFYLSCLRDNLVITSSSSLPDGTSWLFFQVQVIPTADCKMKMKI